MDNDIEQRYAAMDFGAIGRELSTRTILFHEAVAARVGLGITEHKCLDLIARAGEPLTAGQLADLTGLTTGAITGILDRLEKAGFVARERSREDRRKVLILALPRIYEVYGPVMAGMERAAGELAGRYSAEEMALIRRYLIETIEIMKAETIRLRATG